MYMQPFIQFIRNTAGQTRAHPRTNYDFSGMSQADILNKYTLGIQPMTKQVQSQK